MMVKLPVVPTLQTSEQRLVAEIERAAAYAHAARASATTRAYASDWRIFLDWCDERGLESLPALPAAVATFLGAEADRGIKAPTIGRRLAAIGHHHRQSGFDPPQEQVGAAVIKDVLAGIRHARGTRAIRKRPADGPALAAMLATIKGEDLRAHRDRALLAIGMAAALRRSELVALEIDDIELSPEGLRLLVGRSKTDQAGEGAVIAIPEGRNIGPKALLLAWMAAAGHDAGPLFRRLSRGGSVTADAMSDRAVARLVQRCALEAGLDPTLYAGHSLRSGFLTEAARQGASIFKMRDVSRHKSIQVLSDYVRDAELFRDHAGAAFL
jgi:site-specific recombinase XerD